MPARKIDQELFSEYMPADGINAAVDWRDYGWPRWQLADEATTVPDVLEGPGPLFSLRH
jgi:hypothetical protein